MTYRPASDPKIHELVSALYTERWASSASKIEQLVAISDAWKICELLTSSEGWRERVVAAKIIAAFNFVDLNTLDQYIHRPCRVEHPSLLCQADHYHCNAGHQAQTP